MPAEPAAQVVDLFEVPDIQDRMLAAFHEIEASLERDALPVSGRGPLSRETAPRGLRHHELALGQQVRATVPGPHAHPHHESGFLNRIVARNQLH